MRKREKKNNLKCLETSSRSGMKARFANRRPSKLDALSLHLSSTRRKTINQMFNLPRLVPPQPTTQTVATRAERERERLPLFLFFSLLFHKVTLPFSTYTYRLLIKPLNALSKRRIDRNKPERIVFPSFCIHSIHFTFHRKYRRAIIFEKTFPLQKNSTPSRIIRVENRARMTQQRDAQLAPPPEFPELFLSPRVFWMEQELHALPPISRFTIYSPKEPLSVVTARLHSLTCNRKGIND